MATLKLSFSKNLVIILTFLILNLYHRLIFNIADLIQIKYKPFIRIYLSLEITVSRYRQAVGSKGTCTLVGVFRYHLIKSDE